MKLSTKTKQAIQLLEHWEDRNTVFNFEKIFTVAYFHEPKIADCCYLMDLEDAFKATINKQFYEIAETGEGGTYALWNYPELQGEPPVIYFESDGSYKMVAPSLEAFACMFALDEFIEKEGYVDFEDIYEYYDLDSEEEAEKLYKKSVKQYQKKVNSLFEIKELEDYLTAMNTHKNFNDWYAYIVENNKDTKGDIGGNYTVKPKFNVSDLPIDLSEYIKIIGLPITNDFVISTVEKLGVKLPNKITDDEFEFEEEALDLKIIFEKENDNGELLFNMISTWKVCKCIYPFNLNRDDNYTDVIEKIGKSAKYSSRKTGRVWELINDNNKSYAMQINFKDENLSTINTLMICSLDYITTNSRFKELE